MSRRLPIPRLAFRQSTADTGIDAIQERFRIRALPHLDAAYGYARFLCRDQTAAEDVVQEAFLRAYRAYASCRGNEKAWLLSIVRNCYRDWLSENSRSFHPVEDFPDIPIDETPYSLLERKSDIAQIRSHVAALPEPFRETLILRELEGLTYREIAEATQVPTGTVMSRLARAREMLATMLDARCDAGTQGAIRK